MADEHKAKRLEIAHVLFIDIVGYSKLLTDEQSEALQELNQIVRGTEAAREAAAAGQLTVLPTGDGMALVFTGSVEEPVECALEISRAFRAQPSLPVRMGIHSGPIHHVKDANGRENIAGVGINIAQRVMDCGDAGHILVSKRIADDLAQQRRWQPYLHELGDVEVKHGVVVSLVNLYAETIGNPAPPSRLGKVRGSARTFSKATRKGLSPFARAIFIIAGLLITLVFLLGIVSVIFAPAIMRTLDKRQGTSPPQVPAIPSTPSIADAIKSAVTKKITDELQGELSRKKNARVEPSSTGSAIPEKSVAVLPFENLSEDKSNAYFADGIQDEILTKLASIADLKVISRTSTAKYKSKPEDLKTVSQQLGVTTVVEGTVQRAADKVRVNVQLIDARADSHLWAKSYDGDTKDVFAIESKVSQEIADALQAKLSPREADTLAAAPTRDPVAYDLFLKGEFEEREAASLLTVESCDQAASWYRQAIAHDPTFALAMARLVRSQMSCHWLVQPLTESQLAEVKNIADRALTLAPNLAEAHVALGAFYYFGHRQYEQALAEFRKAIELQPNNVEAAEFSAFVHRRQGKWQECLTQLLRSKEKDPLNAVVAADIGTTYVQLRMWNQAKEAAAHTLEINPHNVVAMRVSLITCRNGSGDLTEAKRLLATFPKDPDLTVTRPGVAPLVGERAYLSVVERDFAAALRVWASESGEPGEKRKRFSARSAIAVLSGDVSNVKSEAEQAHILIDSWLADHPSDEIALVELSWVDLVLGRLAEAVQVARRAADLVTVEKDPFLGTSALVTLAEVQARCGQSEEAIKILHRLLSIPAGFDISIVRLKIDPIWDPIRNEPGFQQLLTMKEHVGP
jgi:TolB-like protein/Tfp pilus assembly protein PilF